MSDPDATLREDWNAAVDAAMQRFILSHAPATDHDRRVVDVSGHDPRDLAGWADPHGREGDRAAAAAWWARLDETPGRWAS